MALYAGFHNQIRPRQGGGGDFAVNRQATDLAYKKDMTGTFATQFVSGSPKVDRQTQGRKEEPVKGWITREKGLQPKEKVQMGISERLLSYLGHLYRKRMAVQGKKGYRTSEFV